ncbi:50S ribosomal protein L15 [Candidatus Kaiserbacteria bacterium CG10_big_fil_rev_8_21_14_0_10_51_14]|uniref:Large ribosomal subunit protein uL15 n=1 Tax=Candidatus Kaiserbacteria bacterium CG10_big_fil_rev_8_21_14_0_10_51_14 TaxID=1974610 RepID=A0A2H0UBQ0_9BACT|nr:MAG: 50S ribosomal protein L15 [Candidatus Kaiserbacteria bacterium CG10_big_fil_rev_8_21_14_0_10_51_14]
MASLNLLKRTGARSSMRVGRGGKRGKTSGRGTKGQNARSGRKKRPEMRDIIKKLPKRRGYGKNRGRTVVGTRQGATIISLERLDAMFDAGSEITQKALLEKGIIKRYNVPVKIVGSGTITKKFTLKGLKASASARVAIEKAGGAIT